jgi:hypothetical protein
VAVNVACYGCCCSPVPRSEELRGSSDLPAHRLRARLVMPPGTASKQEAIMLNKIFMVMTGMGWEQFLPAYGNTVMMMSDMVAVQVTLFHCLSTFILMGWRFDPLHRLWCDAQDGCKAAGVWGSGLSQGCLEQHLFLFAVSSKLQFYEQANLNQVIKSTPQLGISQAKQTVQNNL